MTLTMNQPIAHAQGSPHSLTPVRTKGSAAGTLAGLVRPLGMGFKSKEFGMSLPLPIVNCRVDQSVVDALDLLAHQEGMLRGPYIRRVLIDHAAHASAMQCLKSFGLIEVLRRLSQPSAVFSCDDSIAALEKPLGQQKENIGIPDEGCVYAPGESVYAVNKGKRG